MLHKKALLSETAHDYVSETNKANLQNKQSKNLRSGRQQEAGKEERQVDLAS